MRNGNFGSSVVFCMYTSVLTVPMRNGNLVSVRFSATSTGCSYRTYEEWKLVMERTNDNYRALVLTVPMRNGNSPDPINRIAVFSVLTVPMRNGNKE